MKKHFILISSLIAMFIYFFGFTNVLALFNSSTENTTQNSNTLNSIIPVNDSNIAYKEEKSLSTEVMEGDYNLDNCRSIKHTDGGVLKFCISDIKGEADGMYIIDKDTIVLESMDIYKIAHELTHAATMYNFSKANLKITDPIMQERIAYDLENMLRQILEK